MKRTFILLKLSLVALFASAQNDPLGINVVSPSPNAYAFSKYVDIPASTYTGVVPISIPLGSISEKGARLDISLSYHASGIKVDEVASWVGLGWSLNAGGVITRAARGMPERPDGKGGTAPKRMDIGFPELNDQGTFDNINDLVIASTPQVDTEPDIYYYNFGGRSGKFVFDDNGDVQFYKYEDLMVEYVKSDPNDNTYGRVYTNSKFIIRDENGMIYEFDQVEASFSQEVGFLYPTSWYLTKIESPQGGVINLSYDERTIGHYYNAKTSVLIDVGDDVDLETVWPKPVLQPWSSNETFIKSISTAHSGKIEFKVNTIDKRKDCYRFSYPLDEISFFDGNDEPLKHIELQTSYFVAPAFTPDFRGYEEDQFEHLRYRLKLDGITIYSGDKQDKQPPYKFDYNSDVNLTLYNLPYRLSPDQDHWGYFNNAGNKTMIPEITWTVYASYWLDLFLQMSVGDYEDTYFTNNFSGGANREADPEAVKSCALHKITYPTGGHTLYELESHEYGNSRFSDVGGGLRIASVSNYDSDNQMANQKKYIYQYFNPNLNPAYDPNGPGTGTLVNDPREYYVVLGHLEDFSSGGGARYGIPEGDIGGIFGGDWSKVNFNNMVNPYFCKISAIPQAVVGSTHGQSVGYSTVIEHEPGKGYEVYNYSTYLFFPDYWNSEEYIDPHAPTDIFRTQFSESLTYGYLGSVHTGFSDEHRRVVDDIPTNHFPFLPLYDADWKRGLLLTKYQYNENKDKLSIQTNEYNKPNQSNVPGYKVFNIKNVDGLAYVHGKYYIPANWVTLKKQTTVQYDPNGANPITTITDFEYNSPHHKLLTKKKSTDSKNNSIVSLNYYPQDYNSVSNFSTLIGRNIIGKPIDTRAYKNTQLISGTQIKYTDFGQPAEVYIAEFDQGIHDIGFDKSNPYKFSHRANYTYDSYNSIINIIPDDNVSTSYIWGYNNTLPIAKVENAKHGSGAYQATSFIDTNESFEVEYASSSGTLISPITLTHQQEVYVEIYDLTPTPNSLMIKLVEQTSGYEYVFDGTKTGVLLRNTLPEGTYNLGFESSSNVTFNGEINFKVKHVYTAYEPSEIFYTSFEEHSSKLNASKAKSGTYYIAGTYDLFLEDKEHGEYIVSFWTDDGSGWEVNEEPVTVISTSKTYQVGRSGVKLDEVRFHPKDAIMTTYTYAPLIGMTSQTDPAGITTYYEYDDFGRMEAMKDQNGDVVKAYDYNYRFAPELSVPTSGLSFSSGAGTKSVAINSNVSWSASDNRSWISVSPTSGSGNGSVLVNTQTNTSVNSRTGTVTIQDNDGSGVASSQIAITQAGATPVMTVSPTSLSFSAVAGSKTINVNANVSWRVSDNQSWINISPTSGAGSGTVQVSVVPSSTTSYHTGKVTISDNSGMGLPSQVVNVGQQGSSAYLNLSESEYYFSDLDSDYFDISCNTTWYTDIYYYDGDGWIDDIYPSSGTGNRNSIEIAINRLPSYGETWEADVEVYAGGITRIITVVVSN